MTWRIEFESAAEKELAKLGREPARRIIAFLRSRVASLADPRSIGEALKGPFAGYWKYRVGDDRVVCRIEDDRITIVIVRIGHRKEVYR